MKRSRICCLIISVIFVVIIEIANGSMLDNPLSVITTSCLYFAGALLVTTAIEGIIKKENLKMCYIMVGEGICIIIISMTSILYPYTLEQNYKNIVSDFFVVSFVGFWVFYALSHKEEQKKKNKK